MAQIYFNIDIHLAGTEALLRGLNLEQGGKVQKFFTSEVIRLSDKYVPFRAGILKNSVHPAPDFSAIFYTTPYARYHWFGKLMVDPITGKGSFLIRRKADTGHGQTHRRYSPIAICSIREHLCEGLIGRNECGKQKASRFWNLHDCLSKGMHIYDDY